MSSRVARACIDTDTNTRGQYDSDTIPDCGADTFIRASGDVSCPACGVEYRYHPCCANSYSDWAEAYTLHVVCGGLHVKL